MPFPHSRVFLTLANSLFFVNPSAERGFNQSFPVFAKKMTSSEKWCNQISLLIINNLMAYIIVSLLCLRYFFSLHV